MGRIRPFIAVYLVASGARGTLYIGVTSDLPQRVWQHREGAVDGFTKRYGLKSLVWYERHEEMIFAIQREKSLKRRPRHWKINLVESGMGRPVPVVDVTCVDLRPCAEGDGAGA